jgi:hypothetical protein
MTRTYLARIPFLGAVALAAAIGFGAAGCEIEQTEEGRMPDVDVDAKGGDLPNYDVEKTDDGELPDVDVDAKGELKVPEYDVDAPDVDVDADAGRLPEYEVQKKQDGALPDVDVDINDPDAADADTNATE